MTKLLLFLYGALIVAAFLLYKSYLFASISIAVVLTVLLVLGITIAVNVGSAESALEKGDSARALTKIGGVFRLPFSLLRLCSPTGEGLADALLCRSRALMDQEHFDRAETDLQYLIRTKALGNQRQFAKAVLTLSEVLHRRGQLGDAVDVLSKHDNSTLFGEYYPFFVHNATLRHFWVASELDPASAAEEARRLWLSRISQFSPESKKATEDLQQAQEALLAMLNRRAQRTSGGSNHEESNMTLQVLLSAIEGQDEAQKAACLSSWLTGNIPSLLATATHNPTFVLDVAGALTKARVFIRLESQPEQLAALLHCIGVAFVTDGFVPEALITASAIKETLSESPRRNMPFQAAGQAYIWALKLMEEYEVGNLPDKPIMLLELILMCPNTEHNRTLRRAASAAMVASLGNRPREAIDRYEEAAEQVGTNVSLETRVACTLWLAKHQRAFRCGDLATSTLNKLHLMLTRQPTGTDVMLLAATCSNAAEHLGCKEYAKKFAEHVKLLSANPGLQGHAQVRAILLVKHLL